MSPNPLLQTLRERVSHLEENQMRFARTIPVAEPVDRQMPFGGLPAGCIHEIKGGSLAAALAFSSILSARIAGGQGNILYIAPDRTLHPLGLLPYEIPLERLLYVSVRRPRDAAWAAMEALRCPQVNAVMTVLDGLDLVASRRLQLAAETSGATGFLLGAGASAPVASPVTRWRVDPLARRGKRFDEPVWKLDLLYCRGGRPGNWILEWRERKLQTAAGQPVERRAMPRAAQPERASLPEALAG